MYGLFCSYTYEGCSLILVICLIAFPVDNQRECCSYAVKPNMASQVHIHSLNLDLNFKPWFENFKPGFENFKPGFKTQSTH